MSDDTIRAALEAAGPLAAALIVLHRRNVPTDVQALLVYGDERGNVAPGALAAAVAAAVEEAAAKEDRDDV